MNSELWSVVVTGFTGKCSELAEAVPSIFGRHGLDVFSLTLGREKHLPAEVADNLSADKANSIVTRLEVVGAHALAVLTAQVLEVCHRAAETWPTRSAGRFHFTEIDGMIFTLSPLNARENLDLARSKGWFSTPWRYERGANHMHADMGCPDREHIRQELRRAERLEAALREAYPTVSFVISHIPAYAISFWQSTGEYPDLSRLYCEPRNGKVWCQQCEGYQPYILIESPDAEFPQAEWGRCSNCGDDVLVRVWELLRNVVPG